MKTTLEAPVAFSDPQLAPRPEHLSEVVGQDLMDGVTQLEGWVRSTYHHTTCEWKFSAQSGWYEIVSVRDRRAFYFIPKVGDFRLNLVLGDKAIQSLDATPHAKRVGLLLKSAKHYAEGTVISLDRRTFEPAVAMALVRAKLAH